MTNDKSRISRSFRDILLYNNDVLAHLFKHSLDIIQLGDAIKNRIGAPLNKHFCVANFSPETLVILADSAVWATRLRFRTAEILRIARNCPGLKDLQTVRIRVNPLPVEDTNREEPAHMSPATSRLLKEVAENTNDPDIKAALLKLSGHI